MDFKKFADSFMALIATAPPEKREEFLSYVRELSGGKPDLEKIIANGIKYNQLIHVIPDPIVTLGFEIRADGTLKTIVLDATSQIEAVLGYRPEELIGKNAGEYMTPSSLKNAEHSFDLPAIQTLSGKGEKDRITIELEMMRKDRSNVWLQLNGNFTSEKDGSAKFVGVLRDVDKLIYNGTHDEVTGLLNFRPFMEKMGEQIDYVKRFGPEDFSIAVIFVDGDNVKPINDNLGHPAGTEYIRTIAQILTMQKRKLDMACRYGGDEFIMSGIVDIEDGADAMLSGLRKKFEREFTIGGSTVCMNDKAIRMSASFGMAVYPHAAQSPKELVEIADARMYEEKNRKKAAKIGAYSM